jgi:hypothetical protein
MIKLVEFVKFINIALMSKQIIPPEQGKNSVTGFSRYFMK